MIWKNACLFYYHANEDNEWKQWALEIKTITIIVRDSNKWNWKACSLQEVTEKGLGKKGGKEAKGKLLNHLHQVKCLNSWQSDCKWGLWAPMSCGVTSCLSADSHCGLVIRWSRGLADVELKATAPPLDHGQRRNLCHKECWRKRGQLVLRVLNYTVQIFPEGEFWTVSTFFSPSWSRADSRGDLNAYIFILTALRETAGRLSPGADSESAAFYLLWDWFLCSDSFCRSNVCFLCVQSLNIH